MSARRSMARRLDLAQGVVDLSHGAGGRAMTQLIEELFVAAFDNELLGQHNDNALTEPPAGRLVVSTDGFVVSPLFFPGGDIGSLAVHGTVNDVSMAGATPLYLTSGFILEEGFPLRDLARVVRSMAEAARAAGVRIITGDTKVVERGKADGLFITTTGIGVARPGPVPSGDRARPGDAVLVSGTMGDHGIAVMSSRPGVGFTTDLQSDSAALNGLVAAMMDAVPDIHVLRDPTRGGLAATLNEIAQQSDVGMQLQETAIPVRPEVTGACELLGLDPLNVANEGKLIAICAPEHAGTLLAVMRAHPLGGAAANIGRVVADSEHFIELETGFGGRRIVDWLAGEQLPRIC